MMDEGLERTQIINQADMESNQDAHTQPTTVQSRALWIEEGNTLAPQKKATCFMTQKPSTAVVTKGSSGYPTPKLRLIISFFSSFLTGSCYCQWSFYFFHLLLFFCTLLHWARRDGIYLLPALSSNVWLR